MRWLVRLVALLLAVTMPARSATAQVDPRGKIRTLSTAHFRVHYPVRLDSIARRAAFLAEGAWSNLSGELATPAVPVELLLEDNVDLANGFAGPFPTNRIVVYVVPPVAIADLRFHDDWLRLVITHELTHIFHLDRARGLWSVGRRIFGRNELFFPNTFLPSWIVEGLAVHYESKFTGAGRIVSTESRELANAAARAGNIPPPDAWSAATTRFPEGGMPYSWGSMLMHREAARSDSGMRKFIDYTATFPIPFLLNRAAKRGFGETFSAGFAVMRDSLRASNSAMRSPAAPEPDWKPLDGLDTLGMRYATAPRWRKDGTLEWTALTGRNVTSLYRKAMYLEDSLPRLDTLVGIRRVARRNSLDVNAPMGPTGSVYSQFDFTDPYSIRNDLYVHDEHGDHQLTHGARLIDPDVREGDSAIVAVQFVEGASRIVRVSRSGAVTAITNEANADYAEPRWFSSERGTRIAAVQLLKSGVERIVLLDTAGTLMAVVAESRSVMASPSFSQDGHRLVWASDRSGRMSVETADISTHLFAAPDTVWRARATSILASNTGVYQPVIGPGDYDVAALLYRANGFVVATAGFDTTGPEVSDSWYATRPGIPSPAGTFTGASTSYHAFRQLVPRYWQPIIGVARDGGSNYGAFTSGEDILGRHSYSVSAQVNPRNSQTEGGFAYRYAGLGVPVVNLSVSQSWDATFRVTDTAGTTLGLIDRRVDVASLALDWSQPHVRWSTSYGVGAGFETRHFTSATDSVLGNPGSLLRTGTHYPSLFASGSIGTLARGNTAFSAEQGVSASGIVSVRKRQGGTNTTSWRGIGVLRAFQALPLPGYARHVLAARIAGGMIDTRAPSELEVGGVSGVLNDLLPGITYGDPSRTFPVRGFVPGVERGTRAVTGTFEYRAPLTIIGRGTGFFPLFFDKLSLNLFGDAGRAWCPESQRVAALCNRDANEDKWLASAGAELNVDLALQYDVPFRLRFGFAKPVASPLRISRNPSGYVTLGAFF